MAATIHPFPKPTRPPAALAIAWVDEWRKAIEAHTPDTQACLSWASPRTYAMFAAFAAVQGSHRQCAGTALDREHAKRPNVEGAVRSWFLSDEDTHKWLEMQGRVFNRCDLMPART
jgi:hypothetical protein